MKIHLSNFVRNKQLHAPDFKASIRTNESVTNSQVENISLHGIASNNVQRADRCESNEEMNKASENDGKDESSRRKLLKLLEVAESQVYSAHSRKQNGKADGAVTNTSPKVEGTVTSVVSDNGKESREKILLTLNGSKAIRQAVTKKNVNSKKKTFAEKLMDILFTKDTEDVITWFPEGESFVVLSPSQFTRDVLPRFFKEAKYESFVRKLYRWGFKRVPGSAKDTAFYHNMFLRNQPELCKRMRSCNIIFGENEVKNRVASITTRQITVPASCEDPSQARVPMTQANLGKQTVRIDSALRSRGLPEAFNKVPSLQHNNSLLVVIHEECKTSAQVLIRSFRSLMLRSK